MSELTSETLQISPIPQGFRVGEMHTLLNGVPGSGDVELNKITAANSIIDARGKIFGGKNFVSLSEFINAFGSGIQFLSVGHAISLLTVTSLIPKSWYPSPAVSSKQEGKFIFFLREKFVFNGQDKKRKEQVFYMYWLYKTWWYGMQDIDSAVDENCFAAYVHSS